MFDEKHLDGLSFDELRQALDFVCERMNKIDEEAGEYEDPRVDRLLTVADLIIRRMDEIVRTYANDDTGSIAVWKKQMRDYHVHFDRYADTILEDDLLVNFESPESPPESPRHAPGAEGGDLTDEADIRKLDEAGLHRRLKAILAEVKRIDEENPDNDDDPRIDRLLAAADLITSRLDPIIRERFRDDPAALAEWDDIIHSCDDLKDDPTGDGADVP